MIRNKTDMKQKTEQSKVTSYSKIETIILLILLLLASFLLLKGLITPMMTISKFVIFDNSFSVLSGITELLNNKQYILFVVIGLFSIVIPIIKILILFILLVIHNPDNTRLKQLLHLMHEYGRWAMLDVMVVAILIVTVKLGALVSVQVHTGLYIFGAAVLLIMLITHRVVRRYS